MLRIAQTTIKQRLNYLLGDRKQSTFATEYGIGESLFGKWLKGHPRPSFDGLNKIVHGTGCDGTWLLTGEGVPYPERQPYRASFPVYGHAGADNAGGDFDPNIPVDWVRRPKGMGIVRIVGKSMEPVAYEGQSVFVDMTEPVSGDLVVAIVYEDHDKKSTYFKRYFKNDADDTVILESVNITKNIPPMIIPPDKKVEMAKVVGVWFA